MNKQNHFFNSFDILENCRQRKFTILTKIQQFYHSAHTSEHGLFDFSLLNEQIKELFSVLQMLKEEGRNDECKAVNELIIELSDLFPPSSPFSSSILFIKAYSLFELGDFYMNIQSYDKATHFYQLSSSIYESLGEKYVYNLCYAQINSAFALYFLAQYQEALSFAESSYSMLRILISSQTEKFQDLFFLSSDILSLLYVETGRNEESKEVLEMTTFKQFPLLSEPRKQQKRAITPPCNFIVEPISLVSSLSNPRFKKKHLTTNPRLKRFKSTDNLLENNKKLFMNLEKSIQELSSIK